VLRQLGSLIAKYLAAASHSNVALKRVVFGVLRRIAATGPANAKNRHSGECLKQFMSEMFRRFVAVDADVDL
jgi:hypothetical protein